MPRIPRKIGVRGQRPPEPGLRRFQARRLRGRVASARGPPCEHSLADLDQQLHGADEGQGQDGAQEKVPLSF